MNKEIKMHWLPNRSKYGYVTFGVPFAKSEVEAKADICLKDENGNQMPCSAEPIAFWPDGTVKWMSCSADINSDTAYVSIGNAIETEGNTIEENEEKILVNNGVMTFEFPKSGKVLMRTPYADAYLRVLNETRDSEEGISRVTPFEGEIEEVTVERAIGLMTTVKIQGTHRDESGRGYLPYTVRFTVYKNEYAAHITHTFFYDGDPAKDFIKGIGIVFKRKMTGENYNRRVKITGDYGVMHELIQYINIWHPIKLREKKYHLNQLAGEMMSFDASDPEVDAMLKDTVVWDAYTLYQMSPDSFEVKKKTAPKNVTYINAGYGRRSSGLMYAADEKGGIAVSMLDFWRKFPSSVAAEGLSGDEATVTAWLVTPDAPAQDLRHYDTKAHSQSHYEGFDTIGSDPVGISNTNEVTLYMFDEIPSDEDLMGKAKHGDKKSVLLCEPEYYHEVKAFGDWSLISRDTPLKAWLEDELDKAFEFYKNEIEQRRWYGFWNYGDIMHTYDGARHCWKYDLGGYAWQNTELVPTLWLWYAFLRSGREDIFTVAEAMCRHCANVDIYHRGDFKGMGSRHNVIHWGDSCKEPRIAMAAHHRMLFYLTGGDLNIGDCMDDVKDADYAALSIDPLRFFYKKEDMKMPTHARSGPDWTTYVSNWFVQWERYQNEDYHKKMLVGFEDLANAPLRFVSGSNFEYDPHTGHLGYIGENSSGGSHLAICMGGPEVGFELVHHTGNPKLIDCMTEYGQFYFKSPEEKKEWSKGLISGRGFDFPYMAAAMVAFAAKHTKDEKLAYKVWQVLIHSLAGKDKNEGFDSEIVKNYFNNPELTEMFWISTNFTAQWCLNTIVCLEFTKDYLKNLKDDYEWEDWVK